MLFHLNPKSLVLLKHPDLHRLQVGKNLIITTGISLRCSGAGVAKYGSIFSKTGGPSFAITCLDCVNITMHTTPNIRAFILYIDII